MTCDNAGMADVFVTPDRFEVSAEDGDTVLRCPRCREGDPVAVWAGPPTVGALTEAAEAHIAERHAPRSTCPVCGELVTGWEYESITPDWQVGRGLTVRPCGHDVSQVVVEVP